MVGNAGRLIVALTLGASGWDSAHGQQPARATERPASPYEELQTLSGVLTQIRVNYVDSVSYHALAHAAIDGVLRALDPHSYFLSRSEWEQQSAYERGELPGVGVQLEDEDGAAAVLALHPGGPAAKAGMQPGDRIDALNDSSVKGLKPSDVAVRLAGPKGSVVRVRIERGPRLEPETLSVTLKRDLLKPPPVTVAGMADRTTGYVGLVWFGPQAGRDVHDALKHVRAEGAERIILDLRNNPGGLIDAAVDVASEFLPKGTPVFRTEGRKKDATHEFVTKHDGDFVSFPMIVLINGHSASAAEALAGSLQDHDRALILGRRSFGKALVQANFVLVPSGDVVELTIARVLTPSGRLIQRRYRGLSYEEYLSYAGKSGAAEDTVATFKTDHGRQVRGGGGIVPDVQLAAPTDLPLWWSVATDSGFVDAVADSVAQTLAATPAARVGWLTDSQQWRNRVLTPFLDRVRTHLHVRAELDSALAVRFALLLAERAATVRWSVSAGDELRIRNDPDIVAAVTYFPRLGDLLFGASRH
jgi:carboxyl-terminal processing protease